MENKYLERFRDFLDSGTAKANLTKIILITLVFASLPGLVFVAAAMGNMVKVLGRSGFRGKYSERQIRDAWNGLRRQKLIEYVSEKEGKTAVRITKRGESKLRTFAIDLLRLKKAKKWDGKWRLVMFDLPVRFKKARESLRWKLKELGFVQFQKSAWIYPYSCEDEILFIADFYKIGEYVEILTVSSMVNDKKIKKYFDLG